MLRLDATRPDFEAQFAALLDMKRENDSDVNAAVAAIIADVRKRGDDALIEYTKRFDRLASLDAAGLRITAAEVDAALAEVSPELIEALELAAERIADFHRRQLPEGYSYTDAAGVRLGCRWTAVEAAGLYVPGGTAAYPSSVLMNAIPAKVAGVERLVMVVPTPDGKLNPLVLAAARLAGVDEIYRVGGAQAVAALAFGTATIRPVDKIVGPGNAYVAAAKRQVFGTVGIDMIAGPSEILVVADGANDPSWIAADLLSQAEHDTAAQSILITDDAAFGERVAAAVESHLKTLPRAAIARESWDAHGAIIVVPSLDAAVPLIDRIAAEHL